MNALSGVASIFDRNCADVERLVNFDREVLDVVIGSLEDLHARLRSIHASDQMNAGRVLTIIKGIRDNESLKSKYQVIYGQAIVLLVSHFASALAEIFRAAIASSLDDERSETLLKEEITLTFREMRDQGWNLRPAAADLLIDKKDYKFQDMQSTVRAFDSYLCIKLQRDQVMNNIIFGQAARHVIVHAGGVVTDRMLKQVAKAYPRTLRPEIKVGESLAFTATEVHELANEMRAFIARVVTAFDPAGD